MQTKRQACVHLDLVSACSRLITSYEAAELCDAKKMNVLVVRQHNSTGNSLRTGRIVKACEQDISRPPWTHVKVQI